MELQEWISGMWDNKYFPEYTLNYEKQNNVEMEKLV